MNDSFYSELDESYFTGDEIMKSELTLEEIGSKNVGSFPDVRL